MSVVTLSFILYSCLNTRAKKVVVCGWGVLKTDLNNLVLVILCVFLFQVNKMSLICNVDNEPLRFQLNDRTPGSDVRMIIQANSEENKETWVRQIQSILDMQKNFLSGTQIFSEIICRFL